MDESFDTVGGRCVVRLERSLRHPVEMVWRAITEPAELRHWFPSDVTMDYRVGGVVRFAFRNGEGPDLEGRIVEFDPPRLLAFCWGDSVLRFELRTEGGAGGPGCRLLFSHTFDDPVSAPSFAAGWYICFENLDLLLDGKPSDVGLDQWAARHDGYVTAFGLDAGTVDDAIEPATGWVVRFARQLTRPVEEVWGLFTEGQDLLLGDPVPTPFLRGREGSSWASAPVVMVAEPPVLLESGAPAAGGLAAAPGVPGSSSGSVAGVAGAGVAGAGVAGAGVAGAGARRVRWELSPGNGGARLDLTETVPADAPDECQRVLAQWATTIDLLARSLRE
jgi:uncharacterized protein YndB with AHSA1/START domain